MEELINSMVRFSVAITAFGVDQIQNAIAAPQSSLKAVEQMREALDSASRVLASKIDERQKTALNSVVSVGSEIVAKTVSAVEEGARGPRRVAEATSNMVKKTTEALSETRRGKRTSGAHKAGAHKGSSSASSGS